MRKLHYILKNKEGATAIEFAMLVLPFSLMLFVILEIALIFFIDSALDSALNKTARFVRVGTAQSQAWTLDDFKEEVCANMAYYFNCSSSLLVTSTTVSNMDSVAYLDPVKGGALNVKEVFNPGKAKEFVLIQAFIPWSPILPIYSFSSAQLSDGTYILGSAVVFKNEPF